MFTKKQPLLGDPKAQKSAKSIQESPSTNDDGNMSEPELPSQCRRVRDSIDPDQALRRRVEQLMGILAENAPDILTRNQLKRIPAPISLETPRTLSKTGPFLSLESILVSQPNGRQHDSGTNNASTGNSTNITGKKTMHIGGKVPVKPTMRKPGPTRLPMRRGPIKPQPHPSALKDYPGMPTEDPFVAHYEEEGEWPETDVADSPSAHVVMLPSGIPVSVTNAQYGAYASPKTSKRHSGVSPVVPRRK
jgi:hypothetical protein